MRLTPAMRWILSAAAGRRKADIKSASPRWRKRLVRARAALIREGVLVQEGDVYRLSDAKGFDVRHIELMYPMPTRLPKHLSTWMLMSVPGVIHHAIRAYMKPTRSKT